MPLLGYRNPARRRRPARRPMTPGQKFKYAKKIIPMAGRIYRSITTRPSRNVAPVQRSRQTRKVENVLRNFSGSKFQGYSGDCLVPKNKPAGSQPIKYQFLNAGKDLTSLGGSLVNYTPMNLFQFPPGDGNDQRVGSYMYIRHTKLKMEIQALPMEVIGDIDGQQPVIQFRVMVVKSNRKYNSLGEFSDPGNSLFLDTQNESFGYGMPGGTSTSSTFLNFSAPINKRDWIVYKDQRFKLSAPSLGSEAFGSDRIQSAYPKYNTA